MQDLCLCAQNERVVILSEMIDGDRFVGGVEGTVAAAQNEEEQKKEDHIVANDVDTMKKIKDREWEQMPIQRRENICVVRQNEHGP